VRVRLREVAELAGVSEATVSRVLNERPNVSPRTKAVVIEALRTLDGPMPGGRAGTDRSTGLIGILMPDFHNPIFPVMAQHVANRLAVAGYLGLVGRCGTVDDEPAILESVAAAGVSGIVMISGTHADSTADTAIYQHLLDTGVAMVFVNGYRKELVAPFVSCDDRHAAALAVQHLVSLGHRRIGFVTGEPRLIVVQRKLAGYRAAVKAAGLPFDESLVVETMFGAEAGQAATAGLLDAGATAAIAASDMLALGTIRGARDLGLSVPRDWSVVGYDDTALMAYADPPLSTVRQPIEAMCHAAADLVVDRLNGRPARTGELLFRPELVVRNSTAPAPGPGRRRHSTVRRADV
jgi:alanine racemase